MVILYRNEVFKELPFAHSNLMKRGYKVSNYGRVVSHSINNEDYRLIKLNIISGFNVFAYKLNQNGKIINKSVMISKAVGALFVEKNNEEDNYIIHLDYNNSNDHYTNLKWVNLQEKTKHNAKNPKIIAGRAKGLLAKTKTDGAKLTVSQVVRIKKDLKNKAKTYTLKQLAKKYKVSDMQIHRIKTGENWKHIDELFII
jgi:hypothetical protein